MPEYSWIGTVPNQSAFRFDKGWPTIDIWKGDDVDILLAAKTSGPNVVLDDNGYKLSNIDLTGAQIAFVVTDPDKDNQTLIPIKTNGTDGDIEVTDAVNGKIIIHIRSADFRGINEGIYNCSVIVRDSSQTVHTVAKSVLYVNESFADNIAW